MARDATEAEVHRLNQRSSAQFLVTDSGMCNLAVRAMSESAEYPGELVLVDNTVSLSKVDAFARHFPESEVLQGLARALRFVNREFAQNRPRGR